MEAPRKTTGHLETALRIAELGYRAIPIVGGGKAPLVKWADYRTRAPRNEDYARWFAHDSNIALLTEDLVLFDCDDPNVLDRVLDQAGMTPTVCKTPRGYHAYFRRRRGVELGNQVEIRGQPIDIRTNGGYALIPFSRNADGKPYEWLGQGIVPIEELPVARIAWTREPRRRPKLPDTMPSDVSKIGGEVHDIFAYLLAIPSVQGQNGSKGCYRVCCVLRDEGYSPLEAWPILLWWNEQRPVPPWSRPELIHKLESAYKIRLRDVLSG